LPEKEDPQIINLRTFIEWYRNHQGEHTSDGKKDGRIISIYSDGLYIQRYK